MPRNAGIIGKIHGAINDPRPAENAISIVGSAICKFIIFILKPYYHFSSF